MIAARDPITLPTLNQPVNLGVAELFILFFRHLKLELLTQFPASNGEKYIFIHMKNRHTPVFQIELFD